VPHSFVVPEAAPWPLCCQGMRLGAKVSGVRNQSLYVRSDVARWWVLALNRIAGLLPRAFPPTRLPAYLPVFVLASLKWGLNNNPPFFCRTRSIWPMNCESLKFDFWGCLAAELACVFGFFAAHKSRNLMAHLFRPAGSASVGSTLLLFERKEAVGGASLSILMHLCVMPHRQLLHTPPTVSTGRYQLDAMGFVWDLSDAPFRQVRLCPWCLLCVPCISIPPRYTLSLDSARDGPTG